MSKRPFRESESGITGSARAFASTHWSLVLAAGKDGSPDARAALEKLCRLYWYPLYSFVRLSGYAPLDAQDLTQGFFLQLLQKNYLDAVDPRKGKFRSFLLASLKHYLSNERDRARAQKRGGGQVPISIDEQDAEGRYRLEPVAQMTPEKLYERRWALTVLDQTLARLREEYDSSGRSELFNKLKAGLTGEDPGLAHAEIGRQLGMSSGAVKVASHRLRRRFREILRAEIAETVASPDEIDEELRHLFQALSS
jgi:RNA polymerase sigma factor (sigma-70 family)